MSQLINTPQEFLASLEQGYQDAEGRPRYWITDDGGILCFLCAESCKEEITKAIESGDDDAMEWRVIGGYARTGDIDHECTNCGMPIVPGYGEEPSDEKEAETLAEAREKYRVVDMHAPTLDGHLRPAFKVAPNHYCPILEREDGQCHNCPKIVGADLSGYDGAIFAYATYPGFCDSKNDPDTFDVLLTGSGETRTMESKVDADSAMRAYYEFRWNMTGFTRAEVIVHGTGEVKVEHEEK